MRKRVAFTEQIGLVVADQKAFAISGVFFVWEEGKDLNGVGFPVLGRPPAVWDIEVRDLSAQLILQGAVTAVDLDGTSSVLGVTLESRPSDEEVQRLRVVVEDTLQQVTGVSCAFDRTAA